MSRIINGGFRPKIGSKINTSKGPRIVQPQERVNTDTDRLNWLDAVMVNANARNGTCYGWRFDINHNRAALTDNNIPALNIREAIDAAMRGPNNVHEPRP